MADLFLEVLARKDLSRAGDLFLIDNESILSNLGAIIQQLFDIISASDYVHSDNNQSVVEIGITRVTSAIRSAKDSALDSHLFALVSLLEVCLLHDLKPTSRGENPPHAKIASDVISCLFLNHGKRNLMKRTLPVAVKFLHKANRELSRTLSSYLALSAVESADLLAPSVQPVIDSVISGNFFLARVLPQIYSVNPEPIHDHVMALVSLIPSCESPERLALLTLFHSIACRKPLLLESSLPQLCEGLSDPHSLLVTLQVFLQMAQVRPAPFAEYLPRLKGMVAPPGGADGESRSSSSPNKDCLLSVIQITAAVGRTNRERASGAIAFILDQLPRVANCDLPVPLRELTILCDAYPALLTEKVISDVHRCSLDCPPSAKAYVLHLNNEFATIRSPIQTHSGVTIVRVSSRSETSAAGGGVSVSGGAAPISVGVGPPTAARLKLGGDGSSRSTGRLSVLGSGGAPVKGTASELINRGKPAPGQSLSRELQSSSPFLQQPPKSNPPAMYKSLSALIPSPPLGGIPVAGRSQTALGGGGTSTGGSGSREDSMAVIPSSYLRATGGTRSPLTVQPPVVVPRTENKSPWPGKQQNVYNLNSAPEPHPPVTLRHKTPTATVAPPPSQGGASRGGNNNGSATGGGDNSGRMSVFEPSPMRDTVQHFCEKHLEKIKAYMERIFVSLPLPVRCTIEERRGKKQAKLSFACKGKGEHCLYNRTFFNVQTRSPRVWMHLMFLALQARSPSALSTREASVSSLRNCWDTLKCENKSFVALVTSAFPSNREQDTLMAELRETGFFDVFEYNGILNLWGCFLCNHPERATGYLEPDRPVIEGRLKEKKGKWRVFRRWRSRYFTLTGVHLSYRGAKTQDKDTVVRNLEVGQIRSVKTIGSRRNLPKAFEIFTQDDTSLVLKPEDSRNLEEWVQCLSIAVAHCQAKGDSHTKTLSVWGSGSLR